MMTEGPWLRRKRRWWWKEGKRDKWACIGSLSSNSSSTTLVYLIKNVSSALAIMSSIRFPCWQSTPLERIMSSTITTTRALTTTILKKEEVNFNVDFDDLDDEQGMDVNEGVVLPPITPSRDG